jgi:hypothetical protein
MAFIEEELLPVSLRDIPFIILKKLAEICFDIDLFDDDMNKMWRCDLNASFSTWKAESSIHRWSDSVSKNSSLLSKLGLGSMAVSIGATTTDAVSVSYEAPWIMPTLLENPKKSTVASSAPNSSFATARMVRLEGRRQSYRPDPSTNVEHAITALCIVEDDPSGFKINRNSLDGLRDDWGFPSDENTVPSKACNNGIHDVLDDLLQSPTRPSTKINSPESMNTNRAGKRSLERTASPGGNPPFLHMTPGTVSKRPKQSIEHETSSIKEFLLNKSPDVKVRKAQLGRRERKVLRDVDVEFNII